MIRRFIQGVLFSFIIVFVPVLGNRQTLFTLQLWLMFVTGVLANLFQPSYKPFDRSAPPEDRNTATQILWTCCLTQVLAIMEAVYLGYPRSFQWDVIASISLIFMLLGLILRTWAVWTLGKFFTWHSKVESHQKVIRSGPYRFVRHPSYTGAMLTYLFGPFFLHAWLSTLVAIVALPLAFHRRVRLEEDLLKGNLGDEYQTYCREVKKLIPWIW